MEKINKSIIINFFDWINVHENKQMNMDILRVLIIKAHKDPRIFAYLNNYAQKFLSKYSFINITDKMLVNGISDYLLYEDSDDKSIIINTLFRNNENIFNYCTVPSKLHTYDVILFINWLFNNNYLNEMLDDDLLKIYIKKYLKENTNLDKESIKEFNKIIRQNQILSKIQEAFSKNEQSLNKIVKRYVNKDIYKCLFLPLPKNDDFKNFIHHYYISMHELSKDYLDIYYSEKELYTSGVIIQNKLNLDLPASSYPCLLLWKSSIKKCQVIELYNLNYDDWFKVIGIIIDNIKQDKDLKHIALDTMIKIEKIKMDKKNITINQNIHNNYGNVSGINNGNN